MSKEYAIQGVNGFRHWSASYPTLGDARRAARDLAQEGAGRTLHILQRLPRPAGHEFGASWGYAGEVRSDFSRRIMKPGPF